MKPQIKSIETRYKGYHFRSRLESRWAVFFDALGLEWEYEPEGFELKSGVHYLPDFLVHTTDRTSIWCEIKPNRSLDDGKMQILNEMFDDIWQSSGHCPDNYRRCLVLSGEPMGYFFERVNSCEVVCPSCGCWAESDSRDAIGWPHNDDDDAVLSCWHCDMDGRAGGCGNPYISGFIGTPYYGHKGSIITEFGIHKRMMDKIFNAALAARSARFEHGQCGAT